MALLEERCSRFIELFAKAARGRREPQPLVCAVPTVSTRRAQAGAAGSAGRAQELPVCTAGCWAHPGLLHGAVPLAGVQG